MWQMLLISWKLVKENVETLWNTTLSSNSKLYKYLHLMCKLKKMRAYSAMILDFIDPTSYL